MESVEEKRSFTEANSLKVDRARCIVCGACTAVCPAEALVLFGLKLELIKEKCISCGLSEKVCTTGALTCPVGK